MMWSLNAVADEEHMNNSRSRNTSSPSCSLTFPTSSHSSSFSAYQIPRTMEDVWKDINLSSSPMFQDFLTGPYERDPHSLNAAAAQPPQLPPPPPRPATMLTLNSGVEFNLFGSLSPASRQSPAMFFPSRSVDEVVMNQNTNKRCAASAPDINVGGSGDRRHKRMIKNRESAARSRARKQAYTTELELEVDQLTKENAKLREQQRQLCQAAAAVDRRSKHGLQRTSTAPF